MENYIEVSDYHKRKVVSSILNLYLFDEIEAPKFELIGGELKAKVVSKFALDFMNGGYDFMTNDGVIEFFMKITQNLPRKLKNHIVSMANNNMLFIFHRNLHIGEISIAQKQDDIFICFLQTMTPIYQNFVYRPGLDDLLNIYLHYLADFTLYLKMDENNYISRNDYNYVIRQKLKDIESISISSLKTHLPSFDNH